VDERRAHRNVEIRVVVPSMIKTVCDGSSRRAMW
jgi:hypothetical protein